MKPVSSGPLLISALPINANLPISVPSCLRKITGLSVNLCSAAAPLNGSTVGVFAIINHTVSTPHSVFPMGRRGGVCVGVCKQVSVVYSVAGAAHSRAHTAGVCAALLHMWKYACMHMFVHILAFLWLVTVAMMSAFEVYHVCRRWCVIEVWLWEDTSDLKTRKGPGDPLFIFSDIAWGFFLSWIQPPWPTTSASL